MKIGAQMYTVRAFCQTPEETVDSLKKLSDIGYRCVQYSGCGPMDPKQLRQACDLLEMEIAVTHSPYDRIIGDTEQLIEEHRILGCGYIGLGSMPPFARKDPAGRDAFLQAIREPAKKIRKAGLWFGYHNHAFEFAKLNGRRIFDLLLEQTDPDWFGVILDTYWVQQGGADLYQWIEKLRGRLYCVHLKDQAVEAGNAKPVMAAIGDGNMNFPAITAAFEKAGTQYAFVEQDECGGEDPFACLARSYAYLKKLGY